MIVEQIYTGCLSQGAYYIQSDGEAAIIDPLREVSCYVDKAKENKAKIKYIFETHFHADFVSGHITLHEETGAPIIFGPNANPNFDAYLAKDEEVFQLGSVMIKLLHTPGHTMESSTYLLIDSNGKEHAIFTGDTLFLGDVGRPDLAQKSNNLTTEDLAGYSFDSLRNKIMPLPDDVIVYPAHGAGSSCGKNMMKQTVDTLGNQKKINYALRADMTKEEFIKEVTYGLLKPPEYFPSNVQLNKNGYQSVERIINNGFKSLSVSEIEEITKKKNTIILDVRNSVDFSNAHISNSIFIGLNGSFAPWVGEILIDIHTPIILVCPNGREKEAITRLARVGFDNTLGYLAGGVASWKSAGKNLSKIENISPIQFANLYNQNRDRIFDLRSEQEYFGGHIKESKNMPLSTIQSVWSSFPKEKSFYVYCAGGYRSMIAASLLKIQGFDNVVNISGGYQFLSQTSIPKS